MKFLYRLSVHTKDVDDLGLVFHARYIEWLSVAREELLRTAGVTINHMRAMDFRMAVKKIEISFKKAAKNEDQISIETTIKSLFKHKITFFQTIHAANGDILAVATIVSILIDQSRDNCIIMKPQTYGLLKSYAC